MRKPIGPPGPAERKRLEQRLLLAPPEAARQLLGCLVVRETHRSVVTGRVVESEAYLGVGDPAAHAWRGRTPRTEPLWGPAGTWYVYLIYGVHHCLNVAVEPKGRAGCVLIRALEIEGDDRDAGRGPGRLTRALGIDRRLSGSHAFAPESGLWLREGAPPARISQSRRIGITKGVEKRLRFFDAASRAVSGPRRRAVGRE